jgi:hypothetical protein
MSTMRADYYRRQADLCLRLSLAASDEKGCSELFELAQQYRTKAEAIDRESIIAGVVASDSSADQDDCR